MKKEWNMPEMEELSIKATANAQSPDDAYDGDWVEINNKWYRPGNGSN